MATNADPIRVAVVTVSDRSFAGARADTTGPLLHDGLTSAGFEASLSVVPDDAVEITRAIEAAIAWGARGVVTTGGTGIGPRDVTPEATAPLLKRTLPGISELLRAQDAAATPLVALSRGLAGVTGHRPPAVVVNVAGSMAAATSALQVLPGLLKHAIAQLDGDDVSHDAPGSR
jgi:molybdenum cofactor synthesis domain-containing protein